MKPFSILIPVLFAETVFGQTNALAGSGRESPWPPFDPFFRERAAEFRPYGRFEPPSRKRAATFRPFGLPVLPEDPVPDFSRFTKDAKIAYATTSAVTRTTCAALIRLGADSDPEVRLAAALNYYTPSETLLRLHEDDDERVRTAANENLWHARSLLQIRIPLEYPGVEFEPWVFRYEELHSVVEARSRKECEAARRLDGLRLRTYRTIPEATADLDRVLSTWEDRPLAAFCGFTNAVEQVKAMRNAGSSDEEAGAFHAEAIVRTMQLPMPTNLLPAATNLRGHWRNDMQLLALSRDWGAPSADLGARLADLDEAARRRRADLERQLDEWKAEDPGPGRGWEAFRAWRAWEERLRFLENRLARAREDCYRLKDLVFDYSLSTRRPREAP